MKTVTETNGTCYAYRFISNRDEIVENSREEDGAVVIYVVSTSKNTRRKPLAVKEILAVKRTEEFLLKIGKSTNEIPKKTPLFYLNLFKYIRQFVKGNEDKIIPVLSCLDFSNKDVMDMIKEIAPGDEILDIKSLIECDMEKVDIEREEESKKVKGKPSKVTDQSDGDEDTETMVLYKKSTNGDPLPSSSKKSPSSLTKGILYIIFNLVM